MGRARFVGLQVLALGASGCAPDTAEPAELDEVCGEPGPFRLLELDPDRPLAFVHEPARIQDRRVLSVSYLDEDDAEQFPRSESTEVWSVGECGETPRMLTGVDWVWQSEVWPGVLLGCRRDAGEIVTIDLIGERPSNVVFQIEDCGGYEGPWGKVASRTNDDGTGALVLLPYPEDPWTQTAVPSVLLEPIRMPPADTTSTVNGNVRLFDDELFAVTPDDDLVHLSMIDGTVTVEAEGVRQFQISPDRRWLLWQDVVMTETDNPEWPEGAIFLRDRSSGTVTHLADTALSYTFYSPFPFVEQGFVRLYLGGFGSEPQRFFSLTGGTGFDLPPGNQVDARVEDGRWLVKGLYGYGPFSLFDPADQSSDSLFAGQGRLQTDGERFLVLQQSARTLLNQFRSQGKLWSVALDGSRELIAKRAYDDYRFLGDGRVVSVLDLDATWQGDLVVVEPESLAEQRVDEHVTTGAGLLDDGKTLLYGVSADERTGVWLARPAAVD
ncbi:MAG: hypothetical protein IAG13_22730 [Deltaproteobacteria bacterium]|nr:hypothetical protein [Nannocystaceae bacterium]